MSSYTENLDDLIVQFDEDEQQNTQTFGINFTNNTIGNKVDNLEALRQSIYLMISVEADQYLIYPYTYGMKTLDLIGKPAHYVMAVISDRIKETLLSDDRINDVTDFEYEVDRNKLLVKFVVDTIYNVKIEEETVVTY
jgi:hypothetical protein